MSGNGTLTRADLAESVNRHIGLSRAEAATLIESILEHMSAALERGENVKISSFGTFVLRDKRSEEHTSELQSLMRISYAVFCLKKKITINIIRNIHNQNQEE